MVDTQESNALYKTAIALSRLLDEAKAKGSSHSRIVNNPDHIINSIGKISLETGLRKNTISDIINAKKAPKITTLVLILDALGKSIIDFGKQYEKLTDSDIQKFKERSNLKKPVAAAKKKSKK
jgi:transcriptional regulator with XRE-family HTH domain